MGVGDCGELPPNDNCNDIAKFGSYRLGENTKNSFSAHIGLSPMGESVLSVPWDANTKNQISFAIDGSLGFRRYSGDWNEWNIVSVSRPPEVHDLPLAAGMIARYPCQYSKDQFGRVLVRISLGCPSLGAGGVSFLIATLPEGYRPSSVTHASLVGVNTSAQRIPAAADVYTDGNIFIYVDDATNILVGEIILDAA